MRGLIVAIALALPSAALAEPVTAPAPPAGPPSFEVRDRGDAVEVIAHNIKAARTAIIPIRQRLQVPLVGAPLAKRVLPADPTVKLVELDSDSALRVLSVKLSFERDDVKTLSRFAQAIQVGDDLHILVPRKVPVDGAPPRLPGPSLPPELAAAIAKIDQADAAKLAAARPAVPAKPEFKPEPRTDDKPDPIAERAAAIQAAARAQARPAAATAAPAAESRPEARSKEGKPLKQVLTGDGDDAWSKVTTYGALGLAAAGVGIWLMRRRKAHLVPTATIEVIAQRSLGGRARILWLSAGPRELIVSVSGQQVRLLGQWRKTDVPGALPAAHTHVGHTEPVESAAPAPRFAESDPTAPEPADRSHPRPRRGSREMVSPAVSGILRLRARTGQMPISEAVATGEVEADELWAKEILAATGGRP
jgi:flagellar biogenesis protein FliO